MKWKLNGKRNKWVIPQLPKEWKIINLVKIKMVHWLHSFQQNNQTFYLFFSFHEVNHSVPLCFLQSKHSPRTIFFYTTRWRITCFQFFHFLRLERNLHRILSHVFSLLNLHPMGSKFKQWCDNISYEFSQMGSGVHHKVISSRW